MGWAFEVNRESIGDAVFADLALDAATPLSAGEVLLEVERFSLTANNVTYARAGDRMHYWAFFPAEMAGFGIVPAWGFAHVVASNVPEISIGQRVYGYLPMATHLRVTPKPVADGFMDIATHRAPMAAVYNHYTTVGAPGAFDDYRALLQPLLVTSFLIDHYLADEDAFGATQIILSSASSKTAMGLAWYLRQRGMAKIIGLTSPRNKAEIEGLDCYDTLVTYDDVAAIAADTPSLYIDFAGDRNLTAQVHTRLGDHLVKSLVIGATHPDSLSETAHVAVSGVQPEFFFAPTHAAQRLKQWGSADWVKRFTEALTAFITANQWLKISHLSGREGMETGWQDVLAGSASPTQGVIIIPDRTA